MTPAAMVTITYVEGSGTVTGLKARKAGGRAVLHDVRKVPEELNLLMVLSFLFEAYRLPEESNARPIGLSRFEVILLT